MSLIINQQKHDNLHSNGMEQIFGEIAQCIGGTTQIIQVSTNNAQKYNSLQGRWWGKSKKVDDEKGNENSSMLK